MKIELNTATAISPIDGRYRAKVEELSAYWSEQALMGYRAGMMVTWLITLRELVIPGDPFSEEEEDRLRALAQVDDRAMARIKELEATKSHDVQSCESWLREQLTKQGFGEYVEWLRFGSTSEDDNNLSYTLMLLLAVRKVLLPRLFELHMMLDDFVDKHEELPMLALTHGQPASPTTLGKEFRVFAERLRKAIRRLTEVKLEVKVNGATGNYNAHTAALPNVDWIDVSAKHIDRLSKSFGYAVHPNWVTTQIEPHDSMVEMFQALHAVNGILIDLAADMWHYISDNTLVQRAVAGEVGSSVMPHKVNPINFENGEMNLKLANAGFELMARELPRSRFQRDLRDSTLQRNIGVYLAHGLIAYKELLKGLSKITPNTELIGATLENHWEVVSEGYQTILRLHGVPNGYDLAKEHFRGKDVTREVCMAFIDQLSVDDAVKDQMRALTPSSYIGLAPKLARLEL